MAHINEMRVRLAERGRDWSAQRAPKANLGEEASSRYRTWLADAEVSKAAPTRPPDVGGNTFGIELGEFSILCQRPLARSRISRLRRRSIKGKVAQKTTSRRLW